ncbi:uncharacterized protein LOC124371978 isoform X2 [Homalodisca vitripennis]|uniref:uncharacterized protein LOC124371978 isoform X2 n=1 Tax=Homalodisca vitripennis TaxID=197043 RepID=UPI001EEB0583|nr:uncharacterized protein LOC124371978 isoform X2 [Homalodisca vitripennis]
MVSSRDSLESTPLSHNPRYTTCVLPMVGLSACGALFEIHAPFGIPFPQSVAQPLINLALMIFVVLLYVASTCGVKFRMILLSHYYNLRRCLRRTSHRIL